MNLACYIVSINILTESDIGFHNIVISVLFNCMRFVWDIAYFTDMSYEQGTNQLARPKVKVLR
jgi:hypothetical protein